MAKKKIFLDDASRQTRRKTLEELEKKDITIEDGDTIAGGKIGLPNWLETPSREDADGRSPAERSSEP